MRHAAGWFGSASQATLDASEAKLLMLDRSWKVEACFLKSVSEGGGAQILFQKVLNFLPNASERKEFESVVQQVEMLTKTKLFTMTGAEAQGDPPNNETPYKPIETWSYHFQSHGNPLKLGSLQGH